MTTWNLTSILRLCADAGAVALSYFDSPTRDYKEDDSVVTQADREVEQLLGRAFDRPDEGSYMVGEETVAQRDQGYLDRALNETAWIVDPIDGTVLYANHLRDWGISIGFMQGGRVNEGAVYFPLSGEIYITDGGRNLYGTFIPGLPKGSEQEALKALVPLETLHRGYSKSGIVAVTQELTRERRIPFSNPIFALGSAVYPLIELARGRVMAYVGRLKIWDFAGCLPILLNAGAITTLEDGTVIDSEFGERGYRSEPDAPIRFSTRSNLVIAFDGAVHESLRSSIESTAERV